MSSFEPNKRHLRELLIYFFNLKKSAVEAHRLLVETYGEAALNERSCREWFQKFKNSEFDIKDKERSGRPKVYEDARLESLLDQDSCQTQAKQYNGQYFEKNIRFRSFIINAQFSIRNGEKALGLFTSGFLTTVSCGLTVSSPGSSRKSGVLLTTGCGANSPHP